MTKTKGYAKRVRTFKYRNMLNKNSEGFIECPLCHSKIMVRLQICPICFYPIGLKNIEKDIYSKSLTKSG